MSKTVLTVDDSASIRQMVGFTLKGAGYSVIEACDGNDGLSKAKAAGVNLVLTDQSFADQGAAGAAFLQGGADPDADHRIRRRHEGAGQGRRRHRMDRQAVRSRQAAGSGQEGSWLIFATTHKSLP
jgi:hypothetical protein